MKRRCIGVELKQEMVDYVSKKFSPKELVVDVNIIQGDSASSAAKEKIQNRLEIMGEKSAQFLILLSFLIKKKIYQIVPQLKNFMICLKKLQKMVMIY